MSAIENFMLEVLDVSKGDPEKAKRLLHFHLETIREAQDALQADILFGEIKDLSILHGKRIAFQTFATQLAQTKLAAQQLNLLGEQA